jgi:hypothetical protein
MGEQHIDNLKFSHLDRQQVKEALARKEIITDAQKKEAGLYHETIKNLQPKQIAELISKNYTKKGEFLPYNKIQKDYAYCFLTQTALAMLGYDCQIDGYQWSNMQMCVRVFEQDYALDLDEGFAGPQVFSKLNELLSMDVLPSRPQQPDQEKNEELSQQNFPTPEAFEKLPLKPTTQRALACFCYSQHMWYSDIISAAIVGNIDVESGFRTNARGDKGRSHCFCQWQWVRRDALQEFAISRGTVVTDYQTQLEFVNFELNTSHKTAKRNLRKAKSVEEATLVFLRDYEKASIPHTKRRTDAASLAYQEYRKDTRDA